MDNPKDEISIVIDDERKGLFRIITNFFKSFITVSAIYLVGYFDFSVAWLIPPVILSVFREEWRKSKGSKRESVKLAIQNEKKVITSVFGSDLPAWVFFPDIERAEWLNRMFLQLWPNVSTYVNEMIKTTIQLKIEETLEMYANLKGFQFVKLRLGTIPPRVGGIKVYDRQYSRNEIMVDVDLIYAGDCDISFSLKGMSGGIKDFQIHGMMRLIMKPLIHIIPFVGGVQVFFLNKPDIDFNLVGVADILDIPGVSDVLRRVIVEQISAMMVLPNKLPIVLSDVPSQKIKTPEPAGILRVHIVQAVKLMKKDVGMLGKGKSDPYVVVSMGAQEFRSPTISNTVDPKWDFWCEFVLENHSDTKFNITVYDKDDTSKTDDFLGRASLKLNDVFEDGEVDKWISLEDVKHGMVHLRLSFYNLSSDIADLKAACDELTTLRVPSINAAALIFYLDSLQNLPDARPGKRPDTIVSITAGHETKSTGVQFRSASPVFEQGFVFLIHNPKNESLTLKVTDQKTGTELGSFNYHLSSLLSADGMKRDLEPSPLSKSRSECKVTFAAQLKVYKKKPKREESIGNSGEVPVTTPPTPLSVPAKTEDMDTTDAIKSSDETLKRINFLSNGGDIISNDVKSMGSEVTTTTEPVINFDAFKSEEVKNSCQWLKGEYTELPRQNSVAESFKGSLRRRKTSQSEIGKAVGKVELTLNYSPQRQKLIITVHSVIDLPVKDTSDLPDPYVKVYLLPKSEEHKRKTKVVKDTNNPVYEETFEYVVSEGEINHRKLSVSVVSHKTAFYGTNSVIGSTIINLSELNLNNHRTWFDLEFCQD